MYPMETSLRLPALRQSVQSQMGCEHGYKLVHIDGLKPPDTTESERGTQVHAVLARYAEHCAKRRVPADFAYLDSLLDSVGQDAAEILQTCRENLTIDWQNLFAAEIYWGLDADWKPTFSYDHDGRPIPFNDVWAIDTSDNEPIFCGIDDAIYLMPGGQVAVIDDYKSHPRQFPADTFQGKLYALALFLHMPELQQVTFRLRFVRYANVHTEHTFYRSDVPRLKEDVTRVRNQQVEIHRKAEAGEKLACHAGSHCVYCPAMQNHRLCPISELNPMMNMSPADRLNFRLWIDAANRANNKAMQDMVDGTGETIRAQDANGKHYTFGPVERQKVTYPLFQQDPDGKFSMPIVDALINWADSNPGDLQGKRGSKPWFCNLRIGATQLKSYLKAKKREIIDNRIKDLASIESKIELRVERDAEVDLGDGEEHRSYEEQEY